MTVAKDETVEVICARKQPRLASGDAITVMNPAGSVNFIAKLHSDMNV